MSSTGWEASNKVAAHKFDLPALAILLAGWHGSFSKTHCRIGRVCSVRKPIPSRHGQPKMAVDLVVLALILATGCFFEFVIETCRFDLGT